MLDNYSKYKKFILTNIEKKISLLEMELAIIENYLNGNLKIDKRTDEQVNQNLNDLDLNIEIFNKINLRNLSETRINILKKKIEKETNEYEEIKSKSIEYLWAERLINFKNEFERRQVYYKYFEDAVSISNQVYMLINNERSFKKAEIQYLP